MTSMTRLISIAKVAAETGEVPIAAAIVGADGVAVATYHNEVEARRDATAHAELLAIQMACKKLGRKYLEEYTLIVTLEPCAMCAQAASLAKIGKIIYGAYDVKGGGIEHGARVFAQATCGKLLTDFFSAKR
jgi:tRNA(adenine34) deaminase